MSVELALLASSIINRQHYFMLFYIVLSMPRPEISQRGCRGGYAGYEYLYGLRLMSPHFTLISTYFSETRQSYRVPVRSRNQRSRS